MARRRFDTLDGMRGIAAILVMIYHYYQRQDLPILKNTFIAVDFFFLLSGFVIMHAYGARLAAGMSRWLYLSHRLIRLYPLMALGILLGVPGLYVYTSLGHTTYFHREILASAISNLLFIPYLNDKSFLNAGGDTTGAIFPADDPLWSVFFELLASIGFLCLYRLSKPGLLRVCMAALTVLIGSAMLNAFASYSPDLAIGNGWGTLNLLGGLPRALYGFTAGILLYQMREGLVQRYRKAIHLPSSVNALLVYGLGIVCLISPCVGHGVFYLLAITILAPVVILGGSEVSGMGVLAQGERFLGWLSYPVYCLHKPVLIGFYVLDETVGVRVYTGVSTEIAAIVATLVLSVLAGLGDQWLRQHLTAWVDRYRQRQSSRLAASFASAE